MNSCLLMHQVNLEGNLGRDAKPFTTRDGTVGVHMSVAVDNGSRNNEPTWIPCYAYGSLAETILSRNAKKGQKVIVAGELRNGKDGLYLRIKGGSIKR